MRAAGTMLWPGTLERIKETANGGTHVSLPPYCTWQTQCPRLSASGLQRPGGQQLKLLLPCLPSN